MNIKKILQIYLDSLTNLIEALNDFKNFFHVDYSIS